MYINCLETVHNIPIFQIINTTMFILQFYDVSKGKNVQQAKRIDSHPSKRCLVKYELDIHVFGF